MLGQIQGINAEVTPNDIFKGDIIADVAAKHEPGLELLLMNVSDLPQNFSLPKTLRYLGLRDRYKIAFTKKGTLVKLCSRV